MFRQSITKPLTSANRAILSSRSFTSIAPRMAEGDTGSPKGGISGKSDAFQRREAAAESKYIHEKELERLKALKGHIDDQRKMLDKLEKSMYFSFPPFSSSTFASSLVLFA
ncbi:Mitochondrial ATPase inhibitor, IATP [Aspergillus sclerotialis]|uniref:ATPase inhibitor, mitochondrial n=1 Tax=Aspergillus sclerotialis TaxID=2070753 RepID=A0A3A2ZLQ1_9EURO|nr:Mitochondrial ATPase inhibitor, IATP [Aspergillus sclerotialis]